MRKLILHLKELADKYKTEIDHMKRNQVSNKEHMSLKKENKSMKKKLKKFEDQPIKAEEMEQKEEKILELQDEVSRLQGVNKQIRKNLSRELEINKQRKIKLNELEKDKRLLEDQVEEKDEEWEEKLKEMKTDLIREKKVLQLDMKTIKRKKDMTAREIRQLRTNNEKLTTELKRFLALTENHKEQLLASEELRLKQKEKIDELAENVKKMQQTNNTLKASESVIAFENLKEENLALRAELSAFDSQFFDEIEDLKYREKVERELNKKLQDELLYYQREFGNKI